MMELLSYFLIWEIFGDFWIWSGELGFCKWSNSTSIERPRLFHFLAALQPTIKNTKFYAKFRHPPEKSPPDNSQSESRNSQRSCLTRPIFPKSPQGDFLEHSRTCPGCRKLSNLRLVQTWNTWRHQVAVPSNIRFCPSRTF